METNAAELARQLPSHLSEMSTEAPSPRKSQVAGHSLMIESSTPMSTKYSSSSVQFVSLPTRVRSMGLSPVSGVNSTLSVSRLPTPMSAFGTAYSQPSTDFRIES